MNANERVADRYLSRVAVIDERAVLQQSIKSVGHVMDILDGTLQDLTNRRTPPTGLSAEGFESLADSYGPVERLVDAIVKANKILAPAVAQASKIRLGKKL